MCRTAVGVVHGRLGRHWSRAVTVLDYQIDRHLAFETTDVSVTEVVAQFVNLFTSHHTHRCTETSCPT